MLSNYKKQTTLVLGDMLELGKYKKKLHREVGEYANAKGIDVLTRTDSYETPYSGPDTTTEEIIKRFVK